MKPTIYIKIFLLMATCLLLAACGDRSETKFRIGFAQCSGDYWREKTSPDMRLELLNHHEASLDIRNPDARQQPSDGIGYGGFGFETLDEERANYRSGRAFLSLMQRKRV